jgi:hypothetical protein
MTGDQPSDTLRCTVTDELAAWLERLAAGDSSARDRIMEISNDRLRALAHRLLGKFASVRRWDNTDDVAQNAAMRLHRAWGKAAVESRLNRTSATDVERQLPNYPGMGNHELRGDHCQGTQRVPYQPARRPETLRGRLGVP